MRDWRRFGPSMSHLKVLIVAAVIAGLASVPVECALANGPHSIYQTPGETADARTTTANGHEHHRLPVSHPPGDASAADEHGIAPHGRGRPLRVEYRESFPHAVVAGDTSSASGGNKPIPQTAAATTALSALASLGTAGLDEVVVVAASSDGWNADDGFGGASRRRADPMPAGHVRAPDPPPPKVSVPT
jgi:hypothetical protein